MKKYYVPILKWKRGEQIALQNLSQINKPKIMPLIEIPPIEYDWVREVPKKTVDEHIADFCNQINTYWGKNKFFTDLYYIENEGFLNNGDHPIKHIINEGLSYNLNMIPVIGINRTQEYIQSISDLIQENKINELCIRIETNDFSKINQLLTNLFNTLNITSSQCHIVIDLKEISYNNLPLYQITIPMLLNNLPNLSSWISFTLSGTGFPVNLSQISRNSHVRIPRTEFILYQNLINSNSISTDVQYGDYCISNPILFDGDPRLMNMSGNLRYTINNDFLVYKGINTRRNGFGQMQILCQQLVNSQCYCQPQFSWGDTYINDCATGICSTGNAETWRRVGTNHHIEFIVNQLSTLSYF